MLQEYFRKRDFTKTHEPRARLVAPRVGRTPIFVIQRHAASHLHYDFRLEVDGVLRSWAIPKGPSNDPSVKRLAVEVEDHPLAYANFEGTIPTGQYGAGEVEIWDRGTWYPAEEPIRALHDGSVTFELKGKRLRGRWKLFRMKGAGAKAWLLVKQSIRRRALSRQAGARTTRTLTHPDKLLYPNADVRKADLAAYYAAIAPRLLPFLKGRPLMALRCPEGTEGACFFQKHWTQSVPPGIQASNGEPYFRVESAAGLRALAQWNVLELHAWNTHEPTLESPDQFVFDLDPGPGVSGGAVAKAARAVKDALEGHGMKAFLKATGGKGLHVVTPVRSGLTWEAGLRFCRDLCEEIRREHPRDFVLGVSKAKRRGKIFLDYLRNSRGATAVVPYSPRARSGAPLAWPLSWAELPKNALPKLVTLSQIKRGPTKDPWRGFAAAARWPKGLNLRVPR